jgi:3-deoxy-D-manno-octulosonic-acid transferase
VTPGELIYRAAARAAPALLRVASPFSGKLARGLAGRRHAVASMREWAALSRDPSRPLIWLHAPSVGEALMGQAILAEAKLLMPGVQSAFTWFSPSAERLASRIGADWTGYLPWDRPRDIRNALDALRPAAIGFVRTEIWPELVRQAQQRGIRVVLLNAVLAAGSSRTGPGARFLLGPAYRRLAAVGAVTADDAERFHVLGVPPERTRVTGDARFDQVWQRVSAPVAKPLVAALRDGARPCLVAGSTWPVDEDMLLQALGHAWQRGARGRLVVAPHEPTPGHVRRLEARLDAGGFSHARLPALDDTAHEDVDVLVVDRVGVLADLYAAAHAAYVGGGFGSAGLHSVVEPAALGVPVVFGPRHGNAREAGRLALVGGGAVVRNPQELADHLLAWVADGGRTAEGAAAGNAARRFVQAERGGARRNATLLVND